MKYLTISWSVTVTGPPFFICSLKRGTTEEEEPKTFPNLTIENLVFILLGAFSCCLAKLCKINSENLLVAPITFVGLTALSVEIKTKLLTFPLIAGAAFGFGWTPCIGPILGSILALASTEQSLNRGILLLVFYSLGLAIPFILSGYLIQKFLVFSKNLKSKMNIILKSGGALLLITGILMITNQLQALGFYLLKYIPVLQNIG